MDNPFKDGGSGVAPALKEDGEGWQQMKAARPDGSQHLGKEQHDLGQVVVVPLRQLAVHGRADHHKHVRVGLAVLGKGSPELLKDWLDTRLDAV